MLTTRVLPPEEWDRLTGEIGAVRDQLPPDRTTVLVVEDDGAIVGCWALLTIYHAEGVWVHPAYRKRTSVARRLWVGMWALVQSLGAESFVTGAHAPEIDALLRERGTLLPPEYVLCLSPRS